MESDQHLNKAVSQQERGAGWQFLNLMKDESAHYATRQSTSKFTYMDGTVTQVWKDFINDKGYIVSIPWTWTSIEEVQGECDNLI